MDEIQKSILKIDGDGKAAFPLAKFIWLRFLGLLCFIPIAALIAYYLLS